MTDVSLFNSIRVGPLSLCIKQSAISVHETVLRIAFVSMIVLIFPHASLMQKSIKGVSASGNESLLMMWNIAKKMLKLIKVSWNTKWAEKGGGKTVVCFHI